MRYIIEIAGAVLAAAAVVVAVIAVREAGFNARETAALHARLDEAVHKLDGAAAAVKRSDSSIQYLQESIDSLDRRVERLAARSEAGPEESASDAPEAPRKSSRPRSSAREAASKLAERESEDTPPRSDWVVLKIDLPKPMYVGKPKNIRSGNLEEDAFPHRPPLRAPRDVKNVSRGKPVIASDAPIIGELAMVTDGDKEGSDGSYIELGPGVQWVQIDLEDAYAVFAVVIWHYHAQARAYHDVIVQVSDNPDFLEGVQTIFNNDHDDSAHLGAGTDKEYIETNEGRLIDAKGARGRYVRCYSNGSTNNDMNHVIEVEVYGRPVK